MYVDILFLGNTETVEIRGHGCLKLLLSGSEKVNIAAIFFIAASRGLSP